MTGDVERFTNYVQMAIWAFNHTDDNRLASIEKEARLVYEQGRITYHEMETIVNVISIFRMDIISRKIDGGGAAVCGCGIRILSPICPDNNCSGNGENAV